jgi:hypothetical protein
LEALAFALQAAVQASIALVSFDADMADLGTSVEDVRVVVTIDRQTRSLVFASAKAHDERSGDMLASAAAIYRVAG